MAGLWSVGKASEVRLMKFVVTFGVLAASFLQEFWQAFNKETSAVQLFSITWTLQENLEIHSKRR